MIRRPRLRGPLLAASAVSLLGCDVPTLTFPDAAIDGLEASLTDALDEVALDGADASCPVQPPSGTSMCCNSVPCSGACDAHCADCEMKCAATGSVCCASNSVTCHPLGFICH
jgi:hypothetical protein